MADREIPPVRHPRPAYLRPRSLALVGAGGAVGTTVRYLLEAAVIPAPGQVPWVTFVINVTGAFLLGALLTTLARTGEDAGWRRSVRLGVGTGMLGGYTTYSTFAVEVHSLLGAGSTWTGTIYAAGTVLAGVAAAALGLLLARWLVRARGGEAAP